MTNHIVSTSHCIFFGSLTASFEWLQLPWYIRNFVDIMDKLLRCPNGIHHDWTFMNHAWEDVAFLQYPNEFFLIFKHILH